MPLNRQECMSKYGAMGLAMAERAGWRDWPSVALAVEELAYRRGDADSLHDSATVFTVAETARQLQSAAPPDVFAAWCEAWWNYGMLRCPQRGWHPQALQRAMDRNSRAVVNYVEAISLHDWDRCGAHRRAVHRTAYDVVKILEG